MALKVKTVFLKKITHLSLQELVLQVFSTQFNSGVCALELSFTTIDQARKKSSTHSNAGRELFPRRGKLADNTVHQARLFNIQSLG